MLLHVNFLSDHVNILKYDSIFLDLVLIVSESNLSYVRHFSMA